MILWEVTHSLIQSYAFTSVSWLLCIMFIGNILSALQCCILCHITVQLTEKESPYLATMYESTDYPSPTQLYHYWGFIERHLE